MLERAVLKEKKYLRGFTLLELLIVFVVASMLITIGVPTMSDFLRRSVLTSQTNRLYGLLLFARSEAIRRGRPIHVVTTEESWDSSWVAWADGNDNNQWDQGEEVRQEAALSGVVLGVNHNVGEPWFFNSQGLSNTNITFNICDAFSQKKNIESEGKSISLLVSGLAYIENKTCSPDT